MTTSSQPAYQAPTGFYQNYTFDKTGQVFADGKALGGIKLDVNSLKAPQAPQPYNQYGIYSAPVVATGNPYAEAGGVLSRLSIDDQGNVHAEIGAPATAKPTGVGTYGMGIRMPSANDPPQQAAPAAQKVQLSGITLDPNRTSRSSGGALGDNNAYLRQDQDGLYFVQVDQGGAPVAYAYNKFQQASAPVGGPAQATTARKKGGNAGGGVGISAPAVSLLGS